MRYLIAGRNGQLARAFIRRFEERAFDFSAPDKSQLDITDLASVSSIVDSYKPDVIINCAAYNPVDRAEQEREKAFGNAAGPAHLACVRKRSKPYFSSDYVLTDKKKMAYTEDDAANR
jgi:dTDP-4-dehydrorhamnose reductase